MKNLKSTIKKEISELRLSTLRNSRGLFATFCSDGTFDDYTQYSSNNSISIYLQPDDFITKKDLLEKINFEIDMTYNY